MMTSLPLPPSLQYASDRLAIIDGKDQRRFDRVFCCNCSQPEHYCFVSQQLPPSLLCKIDKHPPIAGSVDVGCVAYTSLHVADNLIIQPGRENENPHY